MKTAELRLYQILCIILLTIVVVQRCSRCSDPKQTPCPELETKSVKTDTTYHTIDTIQHTNPTPSKRIPPTKKQSFLPKVVIIHDTSYLVRPTDTLGIIADYYTTYIYPDSLTLPYGKLWLDGDTVTQNSIKRGPWRYHFDIPTVRETITVSAKPRTQLYIGLGLLGTQVKPLSMLGPELVLKTKRNQLYSIGAYVDDQNHLSYRFGLFTLLTLKRNK